MTSGNRREAPRLTVIYWRDIPAQIKARAGRTRVSASLPDRFMVAVDGAATVAGKTKADEYIAEWREETRPCSDDLQAEVDREAERVAEAHPPNLIRAYVRNGGWAPVSD
ncbi:MAG TPA: virulence factor [Acidimicrobiia bacterium]|nr:virulence factor [Acidimicrobiia bacterium]